MIDEPLEAPSVHATLTPPSVGVAVVTVGAAGRAAGTTALEAVEAEPSPTPLVAVTVTV